MRALILVLLAGCHVGWSTHSGVPPRPNNAAKVVLHADDDASRALAKSVLAKDPSVEVVELPPAEGVKLEDGCNAARERGADYYAIGYLAATYSENYICTKRDGSILDKNEGDCIEGHAEDQHSSGTFTLTLYATETCEKISGLGFEVAARAEGVEETSKPEALANVSFAANQKPFTLPSQITVEPNGAYDVPDGYYALYRGRDFRGFGRREGTSMHMLHCCDTPSAGDRLVGRGARRMLETAVNFAGGSYTVDGERRLTPGVGVHVRYHPLDAGFRFAFGFDYMGDTKTKTSVQWITPEVGWGFRPSSAIALSANAGFGITRGTQVVDLNGSDELPFSLTWHAVANVRILTFFATWWYLGADAGYVFSGEMDTWEGDGFALARPMSLRSPVVRLWAGFDL